jgi:hypothetical protein
MRRYWNLKDEALSGEQTLEEARTCHKTAYVMMNHYSYFQKIKAVLIILATELS